MHLFPLRLSHQQSPCLCAVMSPVLCWVVSCGCAERRRGGPSAPVSGLPDGERHPDFSALLCIICLTSPGLRLSASLVIALGGPQADTHHTYGWEEQGQRGCECFMQLRSGGPKDRDPCTPSSCRWTLFPLVLQLFKDSLLILFIFQTF